MKQFHQYVVKVDGSCRLTIRNRQHLRKFIPFNRATRQDVIENILPSTKVQESSPPSSNQEDSPTQAPESRNVLDQPNPTSAAPDHPSPSVHPATSSNIPDPEPNNNTTAPSPVLVKKIPTALKRLQSHNAPGAEEVAPLRRLRNRCNKD